MTVMTPTEIRNLVRYKYNGGDTSYIYKYALSPLAQFCVDNFTPTTVAPNVITTGGLIFSLLSFVITIVYNPTLSVDAPRWIHLATAVNLFIYQTLDNMDGKQARKTGSSSALGMIYDHGIDAINAGLLMLPIASALGTGETMKLFLLYGMGFFPFYMQGWEEFYREELVLPVVNGPTEGLLVVMGLCTTSFFHGAEFWQDSIATSPELLQKYSFLPTSYSNFDILALAFAIATICTTACNFIVALPMAEKKENSSAPRALLNLVPFVVFCVSAFCWCFLSQVALQKYAIWTTLLLGSVFVELITHVMLMHICHSYIRPGERYTMWIPLVLAANVAFCPSDGALVDESLLIIPLTLLSIAYSTHRFCMICCEAADALDIFVYRMGKRSAVKKMD